MRIILFIVIALIAGVITLTKMAIGRVTGDEQLKNANPRNEAQDLIKQTAKGVSWMEKQWEEAKKEAADDDNTEKLPRKRD